MRAAESRRWLAVTCAAIAGAAGLAHADWTQTYIATDPVAREVTLTGINAEGTQASSENIGFERVTSPLAYALLRNAPEASITTSTALALVEAADYRNITTGVLVNPDLRDSAGRIGSITRFEIVGNTGYVSAIDYGSGELVLARLNIPAAQFSVLANAPITGFSTTKSYFIKTVADAANISVTAYDAAQGLTGSAAVASVNNGGIINPANNLVSGTGLFVRADGQATPAIATFGRLYAETLLRETQYVGSAEDDLFWLNNDGSLWVWAMNDTAIDAASYVTSLPTGWSVPTTADFNDDGVADLVCFNEATGQSGVIVSNTSGAPVWAPLPTLGANEWELVGSGDFSSDGVPDLVYLNVSTRTLWLRRIGRNAAGGGVGAVPASRATTPFFVVPEGWRFQIAHDFNRDGETDILFRNIDGLNGYLVLDDTVATGWQEIDSIPSTDWNVVGLSDLNDDGQSDLLWRDSNGTMFGWVMNQAALQSVVSFPTLGTTWTPSN
jgi:hypothetical protein